jgi:hypothetical protein
MTPSLERWQLVTFHLCASHFISGRGGVQTVCCAHAGHTNNLFGLSHFHKLNMNTESSLPLLYSASCFESSNGNVSSTNITDPLLESSSSQDSTRVNDASGISNENKSLVLVVNVVFSDARVWTSGLLLGFSVQMITMFAYAGMITKWGVESVDSSSSIFQGRGNLFAVVKVLSQIDLVLYATIWAAFALIMTKWGLSLLQRKFDKQKESSNNNNNNNNKKDDDSTTISATTTTLETVHQLNRRVVFYAGVNFLVGIVVGSFVAWTMIDLKLGLPVPFLSIVGNVLIDLFLCFASVRCYDLGEELLEESEEEEEEDDEEEECSHYC